MPRILRILNRLIIGGPSLNATYLTKYMAPEFETLLVIGGKDEQEQDATHFTEQLNLKPYEIPSMKRSISLIEDYKAYNEIKKIIKDFKPDIVHSHAAKSGALGRLAAHACNVPVIVHTFHGHVFHSYFNKFKTNLFIQIERYLAKKSNGIVAISDIQKNELSYIYKICPPEKIKVIPLGLDLDKFQMNQDLKRKLFRNKYFVTDDEIAIGIIGRIVPVKNHELFIKSIAKLVSQSNKKLRFFIIGDGESRNNIEHIILKNNLEYTYFPQNPQSAQIICTSWLTEVDEVLAGLDIVALSSHNEGTPLSLIEAQAAARPIVSTDVGGVADIMLNYQSGLISPPNDSDMFCNNLLQLTENELLRKNYGEAGRHFVSNRFSYQQLVKNMSDYYYQLLDQKK